MHDQVINSALLSNEVNLTHAHGLESLNSAQWMIPYRRLNFDLGKKNKIRHHM